MVDAEKMKRFQYQSTPRGKEILQMFESMKNIYCTELGIPFSEIKTGKLTPLVNGTTNMIDKFIED